MPANEEALQFMFVEIRVKTQKLDEGLDRAIKNGKDKAQTLEDAFKRVRIDFDTKFAKMRISELSALQKKLQAELQKKISLNVSVLSLQSTKEKLDKVNSAMNMINPKPVGEGLSKWAMIMTGVNQSFELVRNTFSGLKNLISESVKSATGLEVLRANFQGSAEDMELFRKATAGTVSEANLIKLSNQASDLGVSLRDQAIMFSMAEDAADKYGGGVEENFQRVVLASEGNVRGLKSLGIQKAVYENIVKDLAKAYGNEISQLDADIQKQIRLQAILKASGQTIEDVKNKTKDNADKFDALSVRVEEAKVSFGNLVAKGLLPLIEAFDNSGKSSKDIVSAIIGIGGVALQALPMLVNLRVAQALLGKQALITAGEMGVATAATNANTIAASGWISKLGLGLIAGIGVAVGLGAGKLIDYIKYDLPEQINEASKEAAKKLKADEFGDAMDRIFNKGQRFVPGQGTFTITSGTDTKNISIEVDKIKAKIKELTDANEKAGISLEQYHKNLSEINKLQEQLNGKTQAQTVNVQQFYDAIKFASDQYYKYKLKQIEDEKNAFIKAGTSKVDAEKLANDKLFQLNQDRAQFQNAVDLKNNDLQAKGLEKIPYSMEVQKANDLLDEQHKRLMQILEDIEKINDEERARYNKELDDISKIGNELERAFSKSGDSLLSKLNEALQIAIKIAKAIKNNEGPLEILGEIIPAIGFLFGLHKGGTVVNSGGRISVGPGFASGTDFVVPHGFPNDSYPFRVESGERVTVTPANRVAESMSGIKGSDERLIMAIQAMNMNLVKKDFKVTVINNAPDLRTTVWKNEGMRNRIIREGKNLNEAR